MSQSALARQVGCKQSALSLFEGGRMTALNAQVIGKLCSTFGLLPPGTAEVNGNSALAVAEAGTRTFCPNPECPSNVAYSVGERVVFAPRGHLAGAGEKHCAWCGEVLERACGACGAPVNAGAFCSACGEAYVASESVKADEKRTALSEQLAKWVNPQA